MGVHKHILDDIPEDTDVFLAMTRKPSTPEIIITWEYTYMLNPDGTIKYQGESAKMCGKKEKKEPGRPGATCGCLPRQAPGARTLPPVADADLQPRASHPAACDRNLQGWNFLVQPTPSRRL